MATSQDARAIVDAIKENTREMKKFREAMEKVGRTLAPKNVFPKSLDLDEPEHDYDNNIIDGPNGPIEPR